MVARLNQNTCSLRLRQPQASDNGCLTQTDYCKHQQELHTTILHWQHLPGHVEISSTNHFKEKQPARQCHYWLQSILTQRATCDKGCPPPMVLMCSKFALSCHRDPTNDLRGTSFDMMMHGVPCCVKKSPRMRDSTHHPVIRNSQSPADTSWRQACLPTHQTLFAAWHV